MRERPRPFRVPISPSATPPSSIYIRTDPNSLTVDIFNYMGEMCAVDGTDKESKKE